MPFVRIELVVLTVHEGVLQVLLGRRAEAPYAGRWALPGGVLRIDLDDNLDAACMRVARERLGLELPSATQLCAVGGRSRDPRAPWALSVIYRCTTAPGLLVATPGKRMAELKWAGGFDASADAKLAFDHSDLIHAAVGALQSEVEALRFSPGLITEPFTLGDLQATAEAVLGRALDKSSFRRRIDAGERVEPVGEERRTGPFRPAQLFRLRSRSA
jgi:ADP-ribose pyrophosphatase YjhB (NUDIX family)